MRRLAIPCLAFLSLGCTSPVEPESAPLDGYVTLDEAAREAGWHVRVGGSCFAWSGAEPVEVPAEEWVLVGRYDGEAFEAHFLYPAPLELLSLSGEDLEIESVGLLESIEPVEAVDAEAFGTEE